MKLAGTGCRGVGARTLLWLALIVATGTARAQTGSLETHVSDAATGEALAGATVVLTNAQGLIAETALVTGTDGACVFPVLRAGRGYGVRISMPGYADQRRTDVRITSNGTQRLDVALSPAIRERVEVSAERDVVDIASPGHASRFSDTFFEHLPVPGRFYQNLLKLAPGVNDPDEDGDPYVHGARKRDFQTLVAGVSNVDPLTGLRLSYVHPEAIEELIIETAGAGAEFGRAQGGGARILLKQGTNEHEGVFSFIYRSSILDGTGAADLVGQPTPKFDWIQPSLQLSGPLIKDRLWYRLSHEYLDRQDPVNVLSRLETRDRELRLNADQVTWQVSPRNQLAFQFQSDPQTIANLELSSAVTRESSQTFRNGGTTWSIAWSAPYSPKLYVNSLVAYQDHDVEIFPSAPGADQSCMRFVTLDVLNRTRCTQTDLDRITGAYPETSADRRLRFSTRSGLTYFHPRLLGRSHRIKLGFTLENERYFRELERRPEITRFHSDFNVFFSLWTGHANVVVPVPQRRTSRATGTSLGIYFEDQIRLLSNLSLTVGARLDREEIEYLGYSRFDPKAEAAAFHERYEADCADGPGNPAQCAGRVAREVFTAFEGIGDLQRDLAAALDIHPVHVRIGASALHSETWLRHRLRETAVMHNTHLSPRVALAWDPFGDGKTKLSVTAGRYHGRIPLIVPLVEDEPLTTTFQFSTFPSPLRGDYLVSDERLNGIEPSVTTQIVDPDLRVPYQDEITFGFERELWPETAVKLTWVRREFRDQFQDVDINHDDGRLLNPGWGEILQVGNVNSADYRAFVLELLRRQYRSWQLSASYTRSEAEGEAEDFLQPLGNINLEAFLASERSYLDYDQRHQVKLNAISLTRWGFRLGGSLRWESGLPYSRTGDVIVAWPVPAEYFNLGVTRVQRGFFYPSGRRNDRRNHAYWTLDTRVAWNVPMPRGMQLELTAEVFNLLNDDTLRRFNDEGLVVAERRFGRQFQLGLRLGF